MYIFYLKNLNITIISLDSLNKIYTYIHNIVYSEDTTKLDFKIIQKNGKKNNDYVICESNKDGEYHLNFFLDDFYFNKYSSEKFIGYRNSLLKLILEVLKKYNKRLDNMDDKLAECQNMDKYKLYGELITANLYRIENKNIDYVFVENYYDNNNLIKIDLDKKYSPSINAKRFYKKYNKLKNTLEIVSVQKEDTLKDLDYIESVVYELENSSSLEDLSSIYEEISENDIFKDKIPSSFDKKKDSKSKKHKKNSLTKGDVVFLEQQQPSKNKVHKGYHEGTVARKVEQVNDDVFGSSLVKATLKRCSSSGRLFVMIDDKICYITDTASLAAYPGDIVTVRLENKKHGTVAIKEIVQRKNDKHVFECREKNGEKYWAPVGVNDFPILHKPDDTVQVGDRIVAELKDYTKEGYHIESIKMISKENSFPLNITTMILEHQFPLEFSSSVLEEAEKMTNTISEEEKESRIDLRSLETFTIDPIYAKDLDDAISLEMIDGKYRLYVHIADVSHYVKPDSIIFEEALSRGVSIYPSNFVVPMLPTQLSNHLCSLNPNEDKLTKTCMMEFDSDGNMINYSVFNSIIKSNIKMSYYQVNNILEGRDFDPSYLAYCDTLIKMNELSLLLQKKRASQGFIRYESDEQLFDIDDSHNPISFEDRSLGPAEILIESFMVAANETIANHAYWLETPYFIYRNHEAPTAQKLRCLNTGLKQYTNHTFDIKRRR